MQNPLGIVSDLFDATAVTTELHVLPDVDQANLVAVISVPGWRLCIDVDDRAHMHRFPLIRYNLGTSISQIIGRPRNIIDCVNLNSTFDR